MTTYVYIAAMAQVPSFILACFIFNMNGTVATIRTSLLKIFQPIKIENY